MKILMTIALALTLSGCFWNTKPITIKAAPIERVKLILPEPDRYYGQTPEWISITPKNADKIFAELQKKGLPVVIIGLTGTGYDTLALSNSDKMKLIRQLTTQVNAYKKYYLAIEKKVVDHNKKVEELNKEVPAKKKPKTE